MSLRKKKKSSSKFIKVIKDMYDITVISMKTSKGITCTSPIIVGFHQ